MNRIVKVHERISPGFLTPFIFILSLHSRINIIRVRDRSSVFCSHRNGDPHPSDSIIRKNGHRMVSCQATFPFRRTGAVCFPFSESFSNRCPPLWFPLYGFRRVKWSPAGRRSAGAFPLPVSLLYGDCEIGTCQPYSAIILFIKKLLGIRVYRCNARVAARTRIYKVSGSGCQRT